jgi:hypothetical protein
MGDLHNHKKIDIPINSNTSTVLLPEGETFYLGILNGADLYLNGALLTSGVHYTEIEQSGVGIGFQFFEEDEILEGDYITVSLVRNI